MLFFFSPCTAQIQLFTQTHAVAAAQNETVALTSVMSARQAAHTARTRIMEDENMYITLNLD